MPYIINTKRGRFLCYGMAAAALSIALFAFFDYLHQRNRIYDGVYVGNLDVGGKNYYDALRLLENSIEASAGLNQSVIFYLDDDRWSFSLTQLGVSVDLSRTVQNALAVGREYTFISRYLKRISLRRDPAVIFPQVNINRDIFAAAFREIADAVAAEPQNAEFILSEDRKSVEIKPDVPGQILDIDKIYGEFTLAMQTLPYPKSLPLALRPIFAQVSAEYLKNLEVEELIASFTTEFSLEQRNRVNNIRLASASVDGTLLRENEQFSYNAVVGRATLDRGYQEAPILLRGEIVDGVGGGICQVSSTLYNAVLLADLSIVERRNHSLTVSYLPPGLDATVSYGWLDFQFLNDRNHAVWIRVFIDGSRLTVNLYGQSIPGHQVSIIRNIISTVTRTELITETTDLPKGVREKVKEGQDGYSVAVWRVTTMHGQEIRREKISLDTYKPVPAEYRVGVAVEQ